MASDGIGGLRRNLAPFRVHGVIRDALHLYRQEGPGPDMEGDRDDPYPALFDPREQVPRQVKPRRRRRDGAGRTGIDGLVVASIPPVRAPSGRFM